MASSFTKNDAWRCARRLVKAVYDFADRFPPLEMHVLGAQMRRAVHSVHLNIAEAHGRLSTGEWEQFLGYARGSLLELESATISAFDLNYCSHEQAAKLAEQIRRCAKLVNGSLRASFKKPRGRKQLPGQRPPANGKTPIATKPE